MDPRTALAIGCTPISKKALAGPPGRGVVSHESIFLLYRRRNIPHPSTAGFATKLLPWLRCTHDGAKLSLAGGYSTAPGDADAVQYGTLVCSLCQSTFPINVGILNLLGELALDQESANEQRQRNASASTFEDTPATRDHHRMEMLPTLDALPVTRSQTILELGCGEGRYTAALAGRVNVLAVDFSIELLRALQRRLPPDAKNIGLVLGDITTLKVAPQQFDFVLSTLTSNLPSLQHRNSLYRLAQIALAPHGRFVFSGHFYGIRKRLTRQQRSARYTPGGIYRYVFNLRETVREVAPYFERVEARPIQIYFPFARTLGLPVVRLSRMLERIPLLNQLGELVLVQATRPRATVVAPILPLS